MNTINNIKIFNQILDQFFNFLENSFPYVRSDIILTRSTVEFIRRGNPRLVVEQFKEYISPYSSKIFDCDEDFFLNFESNIDETIVQNYFLYGLKFKNVWLDPNTTQLQKAQVFLYFQKLLTISNKI